jgi:hypothetical protein
MKDSIREALESTCAAQERSRLQRYRGVSSLATTHELSSYCDLLVRFLNEVSSNGEEDMTVSELIMHLEDWP